MRRQSGILMPVYSLPSKYGCGSLGEEAYRFIDFLVSAKQSVWQLLPLGPAGYGDSPYCALSSFAGNMYFIDLDVLAEEELLEKEEYENLDFGKNPEFADYEKLRENRSKVLHTAYSRGKNLEDFACFKENEKAWLSDYALYMAARKHFGYRGWIDWDDEELRNHEPAAVERYSEMLAEDIDFHSFMQFEFFRQWTRLKAYANERGISLMGDVPVYVPMDSADVWASAESFQLGADNLPTAVAGVPPDYFNEDGQLWGNPLYDWDRMKADGYGWWIRRMDGTLRLVDTVRIDHFRGFDSYWAVPYGEKTAKNGEWRQGPGLHFVSTMTNWFGRERFVAEDLGILTESVRNLLRDSGLPGMKILQFAFSAGEQSSYLPHNCDENSICYIGTHDNDTIMGWAESAKGEDLEFAREYLNLTDAEGLNWGFIRGGMATRSDLFIMQVQDVLGLKKEARTNTPGLVGGNWAWRLLPGQLTDEIAGRLAEMTLIFGRA